MARVPRRSWERLLALTENDLKNALEIYLTPIEIGSILKRRAALVEHVDNLIAARGEDAVFY